jgi:hypothetical protein
MPVVDAAKFTPHDSHFNGGELPARFQTTPTCFTYL